MEAFGPDGWKELDALQMMARGGNLTLMREPLAALTEALNLGGYKFCIAAPETGAFRILAVIADGDLGGAPEGFGDMVIGPGDPILWESYRSATPVSWTPYFRNARLMEASGVGGLAARGVTAGAPIPIMSSNHTCRASLCVSGGDGEAPEALDLRIASFWPLLRLAGLALFEAGAAEAAARGRGRLTPSETAVLSALSGGMRIKEIAESLGKSERTIRNQIESARKRIGAATTIEAVVRWERSARASL